MIIPNRGDKQYTDIEKFEKYELTHCIAYEMAIRNDEVIKTIKKFINNFIKYDRYLMIRDTDDFRVCFKDAQKLMSFELNPLNLYLDYHFLNNEYKQIEELSNEEKKKDKELNELLLLAKNTDIKKLKKYKEMLEYIRTRPSSCISGIRYSPPNDNFIEKELKNDNIKFEQLSTPLFTSTMSIKDTPKSFIINQRNISPNYSRPLHLNPIKLKEMSFNLNMALPINELVAFIEEFKKKYDHNSNYIKSIYELFNDKNTEEKEKVNLPNIQNRYADMFFIYDCFKLGLTATKIQRKIDKYYEDKDPMSKTISINTITKYNKIAIEYIDNLKYKHLVT